MAPRKHPFKERIAKKKPLFLLTGFIVSLSLTLVALEYQSTNSTQLTFSKVDVIDEAVFEIPQTERKEKKTKPKPKVQQKKIIASIIDPSKTTRDSVDFLDTAQFDLDSALLFDFSAFDGGGEVEVVDTVEFAEFMPIFPGGDPALMGFLNSRIRYTSRARELGITGWVVVEFIVGKDGKVNDPKVYRGLGHGLDEVCLKAVRAMPDWKPGISNGKTVAIKYKLPIRFQLE